MRQALPERLRQRHPLFASCTPKIKSRLRAADVKKTALRRWEVIYPVVIDSKISYHSFMNNAHRRTLQAIFRVRFQRRSNGAELNICLPPWVVKRLRETVHEWVLKSMVFERIFIVLIQAKKQSLTKCVRPVNILNYWEFNHETNDLQGLLSPN